MLNYSLTRYSNYIVPIQPTRSIFFNKKKVTKIKFLYKNILVNSFYLKRQKINKYTKNSFSSKKFKFNHNVNFLENNKKSTELLLMWTTNMYFKTPNSNFSEIYKTLHLFYFFFNHMNKNCFKLYWAYNFFKPFVKTRFYYFTNKIQYFKNQRLVKQPILILYSKADKHNTYSNYLRIFKGSLLKKNLNSFFFFNTILFQLYPRFDVHFYFFRHVTFLKKFVSHSYLKIMLA